MAKSRSGFLNHKLKQPTLTIKITSTSEALPLTYNFFEVASSKLLAKVAVIEHRNRLFAYTYYIRYTLHLCCPSKTQNFRYHLSYS